MQADTPPTLGCGKCGYAVRGISELRCPECGADLTQVGITRGGKGRRLVMRIVVPILYTVLVLALAIGLFVFAEGLLPQHRDWSLNVQGRPHSGEFEEVRFGLKANTIVASKGTSPFGVGGHTSYSGGKPVGNLTVKHSATTVDVYDAWITIAPKTSSPAARNDWSFNIDPITGQANWTDAKTNTKQTSNGKFTDQDLLAMLKSLDADTTNPDLVIEAQQITAMADTLINAVSSPSPSASVSVNNIEFWAYGSGGSNTPGPPWFTPAYSGAWVLIWIIGMVVLFIRARRRA